MEMLISLIAINISQCIHVSKQRVVYLKLYNFYLSGIPHKAEGKFNFYNIKLASYIFSSKFCYHFSLLSQFLKSAMHLED